MAKRSVKKKTTTKKKTSRKKVASKTSAARRKTTTRKKTSAAKTAGRKKAATRKPARKKKTAAKKATRAKTAKKSARAKTSAKKKASARKTVKKSGRTTRTTTKKKAATAKKTAGRASTRKKSPVAKTKPAEAKAAAATEKQKKKKKRTGRGKSLGARSVAEAASVAKADEQGYVYINGRRVRMISTKGQAPARKSRTTKPAETDEAKPQEAVKPIKTTLSAKDLRHYRTLLLLKRAELVGDLSAMEEAALQSRGGNLSHLPIHMADIGTDTFDQDFMLGLAEAERQRLREIDDALQRIANKTYGVCQMTGKPIPKARLEAKPWAKYTIEAARILEGQWPA